ncbi:hypothetical protein QU481_19800 [Crenobacter sp. SG2303]|uniref:Transposase n=1 Tax=Crenobacter oryzisoli TaxID=3056844 RepID=A0ABT7XTN8_9NEIS|nr:hypothetical protein [Crenobacter sp. SG2303]MDN0077093.1 hypothetical protein [Crenobacter sp. SG2303]
MPVAIGVNIAVVALANKNARIAWALLTHARTYHQVDYSPDGLSA